MKLKMLIAAVVMTAATPALACSPAPACWLEDGPKDPYVRTICRDYAKDKRTQADIREFLEGDDTKESDIQRFFAACKMHGITFKVGAAPQKQIADVTCQGEQVGAKTLVIGKCSFEGAVAGQVLASCKDDNKVCQVKARGWDNGSGIYIITDVESAKVVN
jgi:hypothetical protein